MNLKIRTNQRDLNSTRTGKRILQVERGEVLYREDIKTSFTYALVGITVLVVATGVTLGAAGMAYSFIKQLRKE